MRRFFGILLILQCLSQNLLGQTTDFGMQLGMEYSKKISNLLKIGIEEEVRFTNNFSRFDRSKSSLTMDYKLWRDLLKLGLSYDYIYTLNGNELYESRHRINTDVSLCKKINRFKLEYRVRFQTTFRDESRGNYTYNPKIYMRNKVEGEYEFPYKPFTVFVSTEFFLRLYQSDNYIVDEFRTTAGVTYRRNKCNIISFYLRSSNEIQVNNPLNYYSFGILYQFKH